MLSADFFNQVKKELGADVAKNVFQIAKEHSVGAGYTAPQGAPVGSQEDYVVLDTPQEKQPSKNLESLLGVRIIGDPIPKEKKDLKHPLWGPRIKQVIEPLQALAPKDIKFFVDDNEQVDYIWVLFEQSAKWCMKVYLDKVEIMHNCNPNFNTYSPISTDDLVLEFIRFLERSTNPSFHKNEFLPPKEGVVVGNTNTIPKEGVLVDTKENKEEKVLLRDEALKHPLWGPRIKEVIEPLQALVLKDKDKDAELCWDSVDFKNGVGSIWAWYQPKGGQWCMNVYLDRVEITHEHNPKYKDGYRSIPLNELESEFRSFLDACVLDVASSQKKTDLPKIYDDRLSTFFGTSNPEEIKEKIRNLDLDDYRTKFENAQKQLNSLISDPEEYKKIRIQKIEEMLSTFRDSQGPHFSAINLYVDTSRSTNNYFLQFLVRSDASYANYSYRLLVKISKESGKTLEKLFPKSEVKLLNTAVTPHMHAEICKISDDKKWGLIVVDNEIPDRSYGYYGDLSIDSYPFPIEDVQKLSL